MTDQEIRIAMAEVCGLKMAPSEIKGLNDDICEDSDGCIMMIPNYPEDLNAVHEVEKKLARADKGNYTWHLYRNNECENFSLEGVADWADVFPLIHATARQRCEAILRALGKWKD